MKELPQGFGSFKGEITFSPSDHITPQLVIKGLPPTIKRLDQFLFSKGVVALRESGDCRGKKVLNEVLRVDLPKVLMKEHAQGFGSFKGEITFSPSDHKTPQLVITGKPPIIKCLDKFLFSKCIVALRETGERSGTEDLRIDLP